MKQVAIILFFLINCNLFAADDSTFVSRELRLQVLLDELRASTNDSEKYERNEAFRQYLHETLKMDNSFTYPFTQLKTVGFIDSPDKLLRIINWNVEQDDETQKYYCFLQHIDEKKKNVELSELVDNSFNLPPRPDGILEATDWYGALYYKIIPVDKGSKTIYTLLGWDGNSSMSTIKLIDALYFSGDNPKLGSPIFKTKDGVSKRVFYEHSKKTSMSLKYEEKYDRIIFDHLSPETPSLKGYYSFYVPDLSYDAFIYGGGKWVLKEDVIGVNKAENTKTEVLVKNEKSGKVEKKEIKNKWENPEDEKAPAGGIEHIAVTPESELEGKEAIKNELDKKASKKDKRDPTNLNETLGKQNNKKRKRKS